MESNFSDPYIYVCYNYKYTVRSFATLHMFSSGLVTSDIMMMMKTLEFFFGYILYPKKKSKVFISLLHIWPECKSTYGI